MSATLTDNSVAEARRLICSALADLGGVCERLRELEDLDGLQTVDSWHDVLNWATQACETLGEVTHLAAAIVGPEEEKLKLARRLL
jgi:hypothetical protein